MIVVLPFPPSSLAGHNTGHWRNRDREVATYRAEAFHLTRKALRDYGYKAPENGDIAVSIAFIPPNDRGDRVNYPIRIKAQLDGIAEAIGVNDKRFLPEYLFLPPRKPGRVEVTLSTPPEGVLTYTESGDSAMQKIGPSGAPTPPSRDPISSRKERSDAA